MLSLNRDYPGILDVLIGLDDYHARPFRHPHLPGQLLVVFPPGVANTLPPWLCRGITDNRDQLYSMCRRVPEFAFAQLADIQIAQPPT